MKYPLLLLFLALSFLSLHAQCPDNSASMRITWAIDPNCYDGATRGRPVIINNNLCAENGSRLRGCFTYMLPGWEASWNHWMDDETWADMRDKRHYNCTRAIFYEKGEWVTDANDDRILDTTEAKYYGHLMVNKAKSHGFYTIIDCHSGYDYDTLAIVNFWKAMATEFASDPSVIFSTLDEPSGDVNLDGGAGDCIDYTTDDLTFQRRIYWLIRNRAPLTPILVLEIGSIDKNNLRSPYQLVRMMQRDTTTGIAYADSVDFQNGKALVGWHGYPTIFTSERNINYYEHLRLYYPQFMGSFARNGGSPDFGALNYGTNHYAEEVDSLEAHTMDWIEMGAFPYYDPHDPIQETIKQTEVLPPGTPPLLFPANGSVQNSNSVRFLWEATSGAASYRLQVAADAAMTRIAADQAGLTGLTSSVSGLASGSVYYWRVSASNSAGTSPWSALRSFTAGVDAMVGTNVLSNSDFDAGTSGWTFYTSGTGSMQQVSPGYDDSQALSLIIAQSGTNMQLYQSNIPLEANAKYRLSFAAYSNSGNGLDVVIQQHGSPYTNYGLSQHFALTTAWALYSVEFTSALSSAVTDGRLMFWLGPWGASGDQYWIDRVVLEKMAPTGVEPQSDVPGSVELLQNFPNPFNPRTTINYVLPQRSHVRLAVFNMLGQQVAELANGDLEEGLHEARFDASGLSSGVYVYRLTAGSFVQARRMTVVK